jgi:endonuclease/exonuclease/phosphatase family metal-dependent hydrolase
MSADGKNEYSESYTTGKTSADLNLRAVTYNIHSCVNMDGKVLPQRVAKVIRRFDPDVVALQEVDADIPRTHGMHQSKVIGEYLKMNYFFFPVVTNGWQKYGLAILSRFAFQEIHCDWLPGLYPKLNLNLQKRGVIQAILKTTAGPVHFFNTHLSLFKPERRKQIKALLGDQWLSAIPHNEPVIFCGDLNAGPLSPVYRRLSRHLNDVQKISKHPRVSRPTFHSRKPLLRIDHIFVSSHFKIQKVEVPNSKESRLASDHLPVFVELVLKKHRQIPVRMRGRLRNPAISLCYA